MAIKKSTLGKLKKIKFVKNQDIDDYIQEIAGKKGNEELSRRIAYYKQSLKEKKPRNIIKKMKIDKSSPGIDEQFSKMSIGSDTESENSIHTGSKKSSASSFISRRDSGSGSGGSGSGGSQNSTKSKSSLGSVKKYKSSGNINKFIRHQFNTLLMDDDEKRYSRTYSENVSGIRKIKPLDPAQFSKRISVSKKLKITKEKKLRAGDSIEIIKGRDKFFGYIVEINGTKSKIMIDKVTKMLPDKEINEGDNYAMGKHIGRVFKVQGILAKIRFDIPFTKEVETRKLKHKYSLFI